MLLIKITLSSASFIVYTRYWAILSADQLELVNGIEFFSPGSHSVIQGWTVNPMISSHEVAVNRPGLGCISRFLQCKAFPSSSMVCCVNDKPADLSLRLRYVSASYFTDSLRRVELVIQKAFPYHQTQKAAYCLVTFLICQSIRPGSFMTLGVKPTIKHASLLWILFNSGIF